MCLSRKSRLPEIDPMSAILRSCVESCGLGAAASGVDEGAAESEADFIGLSPCWSFRLLRRERRGRDVLSRVVRTPLALRFSPLLTAGESVSATQILWEANCVPGHWAIDRAVL
jgi:hypothetical protein